MRFTSVKKGGWSYSNGRPPTVGKIRLGRKVKGRGDKEHPQDLDYFVFTGLPTDLREKAAEVYGEKPKSLHVVLPDEDAEAWFPWSFRMYRAPAEKDRLCPRWIKCQGDGVKALVDGALVGKAPGEQVEIDCCGEGCRYYRECYCRLEGSIFVMLPKVSPGFFEIPTASQHTRNALMSEAYGKGGIKDMFGRVSYLMDARTCEPLLILERRPQRTRGGAATIHYPLHIRVRPDILDIAPGGVELPDPSMQSLILPELNLPVDGTPLLPAPTGTSGEELSKKAAEVTAEGEPTS